VPINAGNNAKKKNFGDLGQTKKKKPSKDDIVLPPLVKSTKKNINLPNDVIDVEDSHASHNRSDPMI
jgi:hypothetical protein